MILYWVQIDGVYPSRACLINIIQYIISSRCHAENNVVVTDLEQTMVNPRVFPSEGIDVLVVKSGVLPELVIVVDSPLAVLIEHGWKGKIGAQIDDSAFIRFGSEFDWYCLLYGLLHVGPILLRR